MKRFWLPVVSFLFPLHAYAAEPVLASLAKLREAGAAVIAGDASIDVGYALLTPKQKASLSRAMHEAGKCGGYEALPGGGRSSGAEILRGLAALVERDRAYAQRRRPVAPLAKNPAIEKALGELKEENIRATVEWLQSYPNRFNRGTTPNAHVQAMEARVRALLAGYKGKFSVEQVSHSSTPQKSLKVRLEGSARPSEIVVLGGHLDSISWGGAAPGADDNASGSACLLEALRVLAKESRPAARTVEFFWYAGEESGLLGSAEIARAYKAANKDVVAVLQLDMTMFPGSGQLVIGNVDDFTSPWLRDYLVAMNETYLGARLIPDRCGYACSDHASWYRQGYPTLMPFESDTAHMNGNVHTPRDLIDSASSFAHALTFAKIALVTALDLGNSTARQP